MKKTNIKEVLTTLIKEELIDMLMQIYDENKIIKDKILLDAKICLKDEKSLEINKNNLDRIINDIFETYDDGSGYIEYDDMEAFSDELEEILDMLSEHEDVKYR